ncbi:hypothetical protein [uncultured Tenacibaculum sp.]|uniref:hypothetical protein n=1 Tax=uncultured Tenacibaculum sp. TaxID=174713 RepID=UPI002633E6C0|nr:hypothetical protein [uncultured Tenacibaculum sp.]
MKKIVSIVLIVLIAFYIYKLEESNTELLKMNRDLTFEKLQNVIDSSHKFIYKNGNQKIEMKIKNGKDFLIYDTPTKVEFITTNVAPRDVMIYGTGIRIIKIDDNTFETEVNVPKKYVESDVLNVTITIDKNNKFQFKVPVKN